MSAPCFSIQKKFIHPTCFLGAVTIAFFLSGVISTPIALAAVTVTPATGGSAISADTNTANGAATWTILTQPTVTETTGRAITPGSGTIILNAPAGFVFRTTVSVTATITRDSGSGTCFTFSSNTVTPTASTITYTLATRDSNAATQCHVTFSNIQVRPTAGAPLASGNMTNTGSNASVPSGANNYGTLTEVAGAKNILVFTTQPSATATTSVDFTTKPVIALRDRFGNTVTSDSASTIARAAVLSTQVCGGVAGSGVLSSTPASGAAVTAGVMTYTAMQYSTAESIKICATSAGVTSTVSNTIVVSAIPNPVPTTTSLSPTSTTAGATQFTLTVSGTNFISNSVVNFNGVAKTTVFVSASQLTATISASDVTSAGTYSVTVFNPTPGGGTSNIQIFTVTSVLNPVPSTSSISPTSTTAGSVGFTLSITGSNFIPSSSVRWGGISRVTTYISPTQLNATILAGDVANAGTASVTVVNPTPGGGTSNLQTFTITEAAAKFVVINPTDTTVDSSAVVSVQTQTASGAIMTSYQNDVTLVTNGSATGGGLLNIVNGVATATISDTVAETVLLTLSDTQGTGLDITSSQDVIFGVGVLAKYALNAPADFQAGNRAAYTVTRKDQYNNLVTLGNSTVYLYSTSNGANKKFYDAVSGGNIITAVAIVAGQSSAQFWYYDETPGNWTVTASDNGTAPDGTTGINDGTDGIVVSPGATSQFLLNDPGNMTAGTRLGYTVARKDVFGNPTIAGSETAYLYSNSSGTSTAFYNAASNGSVITNILITAGQSSAQFWYSDVTVGTWTITASDNAVAPDGVTGIVDATDSVLVNAAPIVATRLTIADPTDGTVDAPILVTIRAEDNSGNLDSTFAGTVTLLKSGSATGGGVVTFANGIGTTTVSDAAAQTVILTLSDTGGTGLNISSSQNVIFAAGVTAQFGITDPGDMAAGTRLGYTISRKDQYGNIVSSGVTAVHLYSSSLGANKKFYDSAASGNVVAFLDIPDGYSSVDVWYYDDKSGSWTVTASDNVTAPDSASGIADASDVVTVQPGATTQFFLDDPGNMTAGTRLGYTATRKDAYNNLVTSGVEIAYLYSTSIGTSTKFYDAAVGGLPITAATFSDGSSIATVWYFDETAGIWAVTISDGTPIANGSVGIADASDAVTVLSAPIVATKFFIVNPGSQAQIGTNVTVTVRATNNSGNIDTTYQSDVTLALTGSATGGGLVDIINGVGTHVITDTIAEAITVSLADTQGTGLDVASSRIVTFVEEVLPPVENVTTGTVVPLKGAQFSGFAFPRGKINAAAIAGKSIPVPQEAISTKTGSFLLTFEPTVKNAHSYALIGTDTEGRKTKARVFDVNLAGGDPYLVVENILLSPTLGFTQSNVMKGDLLSAVGYGVPKYRIEFELDGKLISKEVRALQAGTYRISYTTAFLESGSHTIRVRQASLSGKKSDFSPQKVFTVSKTFVPKMDFNNDGIVDIKDWSVFLSRWRSKDPNVFLKNDLNGDGKVNVTDFSIFVKTLKLK